jgi:hypothetical protein
MGIIPLQVVNLPKVTWNCSESHLRSEQKLNTTNALRVLNPSEMKSGISVKLEDEAKVSLYHCHLEILQRLCQPVLTFYSSGFVGFYAFRNTQNVFS